MGLKSRESGTFFNLKIKDQAYPKFHQVGKEGSDWVSIAEDDGYEGYFVSAKIEEYEYQKKMQHKLVMEFHDEEGKKETVSVNFNSLALNILNTFASQETLVGRLVSFTVYSKKDKEGTDRPRIFIKIDGEKTEWKYGTDILSKIHKHHDKWVDLFEKDVKPIIDAFIPEQNTSEDAFLDAGDLDVPSAPEEEGDAVPAGAEEPAPEEFDDLPF